MGGMGVIVGVLVGVLVGVRVGVGVGVGVSVGIGVVVGTGVGVAGSVGVAVGVGDASISAMMLLPAGVNTASSVRPIIAHKITNTLAAIPIGIHGNDCQKFFLRAISSPC